MTDLCPNEITLSMHADRELSAADAVAMELHLAGCSNCRMRLAALRSETSIVAAALAHDAEPVTTPAYRRPVSRLAMAATAAGGLALAVLVAVVPNLITGLLSGPIEWFNPFDKGTIADLGVEAAIFLVKNGGVIMASIAKTVAIAGFTTLLGWLTLARRGRNRAHGALLLAGLLGLLAMQPMPSQALEIRHDKSAVFIPAGETINDTLIVSGETVEVAGTVTGDLIAVGRRITIRGHIGGQVFAFAQTVNVDGDVGGNVTSAAETLSISAPHIRGNLYGAGSTVNLNPAARVDANAILAGDLQLAGSVGRDVLAAGENVDVSGAIGGTLTAYAQAVKVLAPARIAGHVTAYVRHANDVTVSPGAVIGGKLETNLIEGHLQTNRFLTGGFYLSQLLRFVAALITGAVVLALLPGLRSITINDVRDAADRRRRRHRHARCDADHRNHRCPHDHRPADRPARAAVVVGRALSRQTGGCEFHRHATQRGQRRTAPLHRRVRRWARHRDRCNQPAADRRRAQLCADHRRPGLAGALWLAGVQQPRFQL